MIMMKYIRKIAAFVWMFPYIAYAEAVRLNNIKDVLNFAKELINRTIPLIFSIALVWFLWSIAQYLRSSEAGKKEDARQLMLWGIVILFVMVSVWGFVNILVTTVQLNISTPPRPQFR